ncbi:hypothetical protein DPMN_080451 [Dreissena polymorpha]|uniref:Uncharacterized protein n=1 Tax=Dreissena polymorpha TaxID=45954 RepID=A0A9D3YSQ3_DREPO|nr:hypothetical protein DPMN_080451 [Dreissena polymorpha]
MEERDLSSQSTIATTTERQCIKNRLTQKSKRRWQSVTLESTSNGRNKSERPVS